MPSAFKSLSLVLKLCLIAIQLSNRSVPIACNLLLPFSPFIFRNYPNVVVYTVYSHANIIVQFHLTGA